MLLITTDRQSAFDRVLASIPFKGAVLNQTSAWWFENTRHIVPNHILEVPDPNATIARKCKVLPIEFVVRGYITGSTITSIWTTYKDGGRNFCGHELPDGLVKNQKLQHNIVTPTTKEEHHDRPISPNEIISENWLTPEEWEEASTYALQLFEHGQKVAAQNGLILVDTKYEFGKDAEGKIRLVDEIHTPDSSRYWIADTYEELFKRAKILRTSTKSSCVFGLKRTVIHIMTRPFLMHLMISLWSYPVATSIYLRKSPERFSSFQKDGSDVNERISRNLKSSI